MLAEITIKANEDKDAFRTSDKILCWKEIHLVL